MAKKTVQQLQQEADRAEARAKELRRRAAAQTKAEEARTNAEIIKALRRWVASLPAENNLMWEGVAPYFNKLADRNFAKRDDGR